VEGPSTETEIPDNFTTQNHEDGYVDSQESVTGQENNTPRVRTAEPQPIVGRPDIDDIFHRIVGDDDDVEDRIPLWMIEVAPLIKIAGNIDVQADFDTILERIIEKLGSDAGSFSKTPTGVKPHVSGPLLYGNLVNRTSKQSTESPPFLVIDPPGPDTPPIRTVSRPHRRPDMRGFTVPVITEKWCHCGKETDSLSSHIYVCSYHPEHDPQKGFRQSTSGRLG
jgi:hypothetical protein